MWCQVITKLTKNEKKTGNLGLPGGPVVKNLPSNAGYVRDKSLIPELGRSSGLSKAFFRKGYWSGLPFPSPVDLPDPGIKPKSLALAGIFQDLK